jgi:hypothetical protein
MQALPPEVWLDRCAHRIAEVDDDIDASEARRIARDLLAFERTAVMAPEEAVDFVAAQLASEHTRFERRTAPRH